MKTNNPNPSSRFIFFVFKRTILICQCKIMKLDYIHLNDVRKMKHFSEWHPLNEWCIWLSHGISRPINHECSHIWFSVADFRRNMENITGTILQNFMPTFYNIGYILIFSLKVLFEKTCLPFPRMGKSPLPAQVDMHRPLSLSLSLLRWRWCWDGFSSCTLCVCVRAPARCLQAMRD